MPPVWILNSKYQNKKWYIPNHRSRPDKEWWNIQPQRMLLRSFSHFTGWMKSALTLEEKWHYFIHMKINMRNCPSSILLMHCLLMRNLSWISFKGNEISLFWVKEIVYQMKVSWYALSSSSAKTTTMISRKGRKCSETHIFRFFNELWFKSMAFMFDST